MGTNKKLVAEQPIKVLFVISGLEKGGAESLAVDIVNHLNHRYFQPLLCVLHKGSMIHNIRHEVPIFYNLSDHAWDIKILPRLNKIIRLHKPVIINSFCRDDAAFWGRIAAYISRVPIVVHSEHHGRFTAISDPKRMIYHQINRLLDPWTDAFISVSQSQKIFHLGIGFPPKKINVIYNGVDIKKFSFDENVRLTVRQNLHVEENTPLIGMVANFRTEKRHDILIDALTHIEKCLPGIKCLLIGDGELKPRTVKIAERKGLSEKVIFLGSRSDVNKLLPAVDVFVLTSDAESFSISIIEAMAVNRPVVSTDCGGPSEIVVEGETGFLVPCGKSEILAEKIIYLLRDPAKAKVMGKAGRKRVEQLFSLERTIEDLQNLLFRLVKANANYL